MLEVKFSNIDEHDTDFAIMRSFVDYQTVRDLFFNKIGLKGELVKVMHSFMQRETDGHPGESDIIFILENKKEKFAIFIEDKINADPQPYQRKRYDDRANLLRKEEGFDKYFVFLCAPQIYLNGCKSDGYELTVSHEEICSLLSDSDFNKYIFNFSCDEKKQGYNPIKNDNVTEFWDKLYKYIDDNYPQLKINKSDKPRGSSACWPEFKTSVKGAKIIWKSDIKRNCVDLTLDGLASNNERFTEIVNLVDASKYEPVKTNKSMSLRVSIPANKRVIFDKPFEEQLENIKRCLDTVSEFNILVNKVRLTGIEKINNK